jgi:hypothetical protein
MQSRTHEQAKNSLTERVLAAAGILSGAAGVFVVTYFNPATAGIFPVCPLYSTTGLHCPGCGLTRGFHALFHGDIFGALHFNALLPVYFFMFAYFGISLFLVLARGRGLSFKFLSLKLVYGFLVILLVFSVARNLPYYPFTFLAPQ